MPAPEPFITLRHMRSTLMPSNSTRTIAIAQSKRCT